MRAGVFKLGIALAGSLACAAGALADLSPVHVQGDRLVDANGDEVILRGCNLGNWLILEPWMLGAYAYEDQASLVGVLESRFGEARAQELLDIYRDNWITQRDFDLLPSFGFNAVRVPFDAAVFEDPDAEFRIREGSFRWLDKVMSMAEQAGVYVVLDLHGAPGGQSTDGPSGDVDANGLWGSDRNKERLAWLWQRIARKYKNRAVFAGYDLLNEPYGDFNTDLSAELIEVADRAIDAIRYIDPDRPIFVPASLAGFEFYGDPAARGWTGVAFTEHFYPGLFDANPPTLGTIARFREHTLGNRRHYLGSIGVPFMWGEFNPIFVSQGEDQTMRLFFDEAGDAGWASFMWSYKLLKSSGGVQSENWYLATNASSFSLVNFNTASDSAIESQFRSFSTMPLALDTALQQELAAPAASAFALPGVVPAYFDPPATDSLAGWSGADIGGADAGGQAVSGSDITVYGGGLDLAGASDSLRYFSTDAGSNAAISAVLTRFDAITPYAQAGVMIRNGTPDGSSYAFVGVFPDGRIITKWRRGTGYGTEQALSRIVQFPIGVSIVRAGSQITAWVTDADGQWFSIAFPSGISFGTSPRIGLAVCANTDDSLAAAAFENVSVSTTLSLPGATPAPDTPDLLANGSFESGGTGATSWTHSDTNVRRQTGWVPVRDGSALIGYRHWEVSGSSPSSITQVVTGLDPSHEYTFSVFANKDNVDPGEANADRVELVIETTGTPTRVIERRSFPVSQIESGSAWSRLHLRFRPVSSEARVRIVAYPDTSGATRDGAVKFDDASLVEGN